MVRLFHASCWPPSARSSVPPMRCWPLLPLCRSASHWSTALQHWRWPPGLPPLAVWVEPPQAHEEEMGMLATTLVGRCSPTCSPRMEYPSRPVVAGSLHTPLPQVRNNTNSYKDKRTPTHSAPLKLPSSAFLSLQLPLRCCAWWVKMRRAWCVRKFAEIDCCRIGHPSGRTRQACVFSRCQCYSPLLFMFFVFFFVSALTRPSEFHHLSLSSPLTSFITVASHLHYCIHRLPASHTLFLMMEGFHVVD